MHFRHFFILFQIVNSLKHSIFWSETGPEFQFGPEKDASRLNQQYLDS